MVHAVAHRWHDVVVDVIWRSGLRRIVFQFDDIRDAFHHATTLARWKSEATVLTYVRAPYYSVLVDDREAFRVAYGKR
jgi:hypothetical protein